MCNFAYLSCIYIPILQPELQKVIEKDTGRVEQYYVENNGAPEYSRINET